MVTPKGVRDTVILIDGGKILALCPRADVPSNFVKRDFNGLVIMAGLVDPHVHINEPGRTEWEGFRTATRAAAAGGVTTLIDMPLNSTPVTTTVEALHEKRRAAEGKLFVDCGFYGGLVPGSDLEVAGLMAAGVFGIKTFLIDSGIDDFPAIDIQTLERAMAVIAHSSLPLLVHAELPSGDEVASETADWAQYDTYLRSRPPAWETTAISMVGELGRRHGAIIHIVHLAAAAGLEAVQRARAEGARMSVETCPHYLYFDAESIGRGQTLLKCAPPIRHRDNNDRLWRALHDGVIDFIATDHSPTVPSAKAREAGDFSRAWGGIASLQLRLPVVWTLARKRGATLVDLSRWLAEQPSAFLGLEGTKGSIRPGCDADLVVWDPDASFKVAPDLLHDRHRLTPYDGHILFGQTQATYLRGTPVFDGSVFGPPVGGLLEHHESNGL